MKSKNIYVLSLAMALMATGCSDFLNKEPLSSGTEAIFYQNAEQFRQAAYDLYKFEGWKDNQESKKSSPTYYKMDQGLDISGLGSNGGGAATENDWHWDRIYGFIRGCNILLEKAGEYTGDQSEIAPSVGVARFFRAWHHFTLLQRFGGVPVADKVMDVNSPELYGARNSRYEVLNFIVSDLRAAIEMLPKEKDIADADKGTISREGAKAFLARVLLYEATWEKYVPSIGYDLDGDGASRGAGTAKPEGYPSVTDMLTEAKAMSKEVIDEAETGTFALWNECDSLSYYYLFNIDDKGGNISNFKGAAKTSNKEFILSVKYDYDVKRAGINLAHTIATGQGTNISAIFGESFLCRNGLPIRISYTGSMSDAQNNPQFGGYESFYGEYRNRDYRFIGCANLPDRTSWKSALDYGTPCTVKGQPYPTPVYPAASYDPNDPAFSSKDAIYTPTLYGGTHNGYGCRKFNPEGAARANLTESPDFPILRLAEVHLIYAEAACELGNGEISDADLNFSINKNRERAGIAPLTNALIANVWDAGYWDHAQNKTVCKKMNMLDEIRRERACELFGEGFREDDLKRWGIAHINLTGQKLGRHVLNTAYMTGVANDATYHGQPSYQPDVYPLTYGVYEGTGPNDPDYGRSIANLASNLLYSERDYLAPIPQDQMRLNSQLKQNPGW